MNQYVVIITLSLNGTKIPMIVWASDKNDAVQKVIYDENKGKNPRAFANIEVIELYGDINIIR